MPRRVDPFDDARPLRLGVPAAARRRALLPHARRRARRPGPRSRLRHGTADGAAARATGTSSSASTGRRRCSRAPRPGWRACAPRLRRRALLVARRSAARSPVRAPASPSRSPRFTPSSTSRPTRAAALLRGRRARRCVPGGWFAFDTFAPDAPFLARARAGTAGAAGRGRGSAPARPAVPPITPRATGLTDGVLTTTFHYQRRRPGRGARARPIGASSSRHRLLDPAKSHAPWPAPGSTLIASWGGFDWRPLDPTRNRATRVPAASWDTAPRRLNDRLRNNAAINTNYGEFAPSRNGASPPGIPP